MATITKQPTMIIRPEEIYSLRCPLPDSWINAIGILKRKKIDPLKYQNQIRKGWSRRLLGLGHQVKA